MATPIRIQPGRKAPNDLTDARVVFVPGRHGAQSVSRWARVTVEFEPGAVLDAQEAEFGFRVNDGCPDVTFLQPRITGAGHGLKATKSPRLQVIGGHFFANAVESIVTGWCDDFLIQDCITEGNGEFDLDGYPPDKCHGVYISQPGTGGKILRHISRNCPGSALQVNAASGGGEWLGVEVVDFVAEGCSTGGNGTGVFSLMGCRDGRFRNVLFRNNNPAAPLILCHGERGKASFGNRVEGYRIEGLHGGVLVQKSGSSGNTHSPGAGFNDWRDDALPPPPPQPGDDLQARYDLLAEELAATRDKLRQSAEEVAAWRRWHGEAPRGVTV